MKPSLASRRTFAENCAAFVSGAATALVLFVVLYWIMVAANRVAMLKAVSIFTD